MVTFFLVLGGILIVIAVIFFFLACFDADFIPASICALSAILAIVCFTRLHYCPQCNNLDVNWNNYCTECGYDFQEDNLRYWECECGNKLPISNKYCPDCGSPKEAK